MNKKSIPDSVHTTSHPGEARMQRTISRLQNQVRDLKRSRGYHIKQANTPLQALEGILAVASVRIDDPRIAQWNAAAGAIAKARDQ